MNPVSGALPSDAGRILFKGQAIERLEPHRIARLGVARTFQLVRVLGSMSCRENVEAGLAFRPGGLHGPAAHKAAALLLARVGLAGKEALPAAELTYVDCKRLELARAMALAPELLLLDEWLAGLNPTELVEEGIALIKQLRADGLTVVLVEHVMDAVQSLCSRCVVMNAGVKIAEGPTQQVLSDPHVVKAYLGEDGEAELHVEHDAARQAHHA